jgi:hypothetical protein
VQSRGSLPKVVVAETTKHWVNVTFPNALTAVQLDFALKLLEISCAILCYWVAINGFIPSPWIIVIKNIFCRVFLINTPPINTFNHVYGIGCFVM